MSFDLAALLEDEINKKKEELQTSLVEESPAERPVVTTQEEIIEKKESKENTTHALDEKSTIQGQIEKLENRPRKVAAILATDSQISRDIDPKNIGDDAKLKELSMQCNLFIHDLLSQWDEHSEEYHPELLVETKKSLFPLLVKLRRATLTRDLVISLATVLYHLQQSDQNNLAIESYMKLSIGNVAWPIGVTSVGIHARSAHSRIQGADGQVANVMLDERTRLWITSIKRLITFHEWLSRSS